MEMLTFIMFLIFIGSIIWLIVNIVKKKPKKYSIIVVLTSITLYLVFAAINESNADNFARGKAAFEKGEWKWAIQNLTRVDSTHPNFAEIDTLLEKSRIGLKLEEEKEAAEKKARKATKLKKETDRQKQKQLEVQIKEDANKQQLTRFINQVASYEVHANLTVQTFLADATKYESGQMTRYDFFKSVMKAKEACKNAQYGLNRLKIPSEIPKKARNMLSEGQTKTATAYMCKADALDNMLKYLDKAEMKYLHEFENQTNIANAFLQQASAHFKEAKTAL